MIEKEEKPCEKKRGERVFCDGTKNANTKTQQSNHTPTNKEDPIIWLLRRPKGVPIANPDVEISPACATMETLFSLSSLSSSLKFTVRASWDTKQRLPYNPNAPRKLKKNIVSTPTPSSAAPITRKRDQYISDLLKRATPLPTIEEEQDETYLGYEKWLPTPPKVVKPRSVFNAATLAYIGDCIYELIRSKFQAVFLENYVYDCLKNTLFLDFPIDQMSIFLKEVGLFDAKVMQALFNIDDMQ
ncbi:hypothetical protein V8G54_025775 [Vigna mungo]|uniref:RNase III domain-containing protein n=1 Tax=Vigna mungo TaxID=3915 RepID=A0AAQ3MZT0_VIGMU